MFNVMADGTWVRRPGTFAARRQSRGCGFRGGAAAAQAHFAAAVSLFSSFAAKYPADPRTPDALYQQGLGEMKQGHADEAIKHWEWLLQRYSSSPKSPEAMEQLALYHESKANFAKANELKDKITALFPNHPAAMRVAVQRADGFFKTGQYGDAIKVLEKVQSALDATGKRKLALARTLELAKADPDKLVDAANTSLASNDVLTATELYEVYQKERPDGNRSAEAKTHLGWCLSSPINPTTSRWPRNSGVKSLNAARRLTSG